ncbi:MAG: hypothetical protein HKM94_08760 [Halobacteria archaeon]|nr:hypothetical protein [Halobacteria archaeon]
MADAMNVQERLGIRNVELARLLRVHSGSVSRWQSDLPPHVEVYLELLLEMFRLARYREIVINYTNAAYGVPPQKVSPFIENNPTLKKVYERYKSRL